jgi:hypothetical protein
MTNNIESMENTVPTLKNEKELVVSLVEDDNDNTNVSISRQDTDVFDNEEEQTQPVRVEEQTQPVRVEERSVHVEEQPVRVEERSVHVEEQPVRVEEQQVETQVQTEEQKDNVEPLANNIVSNDNTTESEDNAQSASEPAVEAAQEVVRKADAIIYLPKDDEVIVSDYFTHLNEVEMSYTDHFCFSLKLGACMLVGFFAAVIHAIYPDVLTTSTTDTIHYIQKELKRRNDIHELQKRIRSQLHKIKRQ